MRSLPLVLLGLFTLGCMCGGAPEPGAPDDVPVVTSTAPTTDPGTARTYPDPAMAAPASGNRTWPASLWGVCQMEQDCGCAEHPSVDGCVAAFEPNRAAFDAGVLSCIVSQPCAAMCGGGGAACIQAGARRMSADMAAQHDVTMGIISNFPTGDCPPGTVRTRSYSGEDLGCR